MLESDGMIKYEKVSNTTRITVCNYEFYQKGEQDHNKSVTTIEQEEATVEELNQLAQYLRVDPFWRKVILSTSKMREKLPQLLMVMKEARQVATPPIENRIFAYSNHDEAERL